MSCFVSTIGEGNTIKRHIITTKDYGHNILDYTAATSGWVGGSGTYPTTNASYPNAEYVELRVKQDDIVYIDLGVTGTSVESRIRYGVDGTAIGTVTPTATNYFYSTLDGSSSGNPEYYKGVIVARKPFSLLFLGLSGKQSIANIMVSRDGFHNFEPYGETKTVRHLIASKEVTGNA